MSQNDPRFAFGKNWSNFLSVLTDERILEAEKSLTSMLQTNNLTGLTFLDVGSGSGLFSLCARRLGATVFSFDYDPLSVNCTQELKRRYFPNDDSWKIMQGSILDIPFLKSLGVFDIVYSWGVLHHTGHMWNALENVHSLVKERGQLFIAIYNDQGKESLRWKKIKRRYNMLPEWLRPAYVFWYMAPREFRAIVSPAAILKLKIIKNLKARFGVWEDYKKSRGMSYWHDLVDWVGGYPFEVATPDEILNFYRDRGFLLENIIPIGNGWGNNQFLFRKNAELLTQSQPSSH